MESNKFEQVRLILEKDGWDEAKIAQLYADLTKASFVKLYQDLLEKLTEEDIQAIDSCANQEEADGKIKELYTTRVGTDPEQEVTKLLDGFAESFLESYRSNTSKDLPL